VYIVQEHQPLDFVWTGGLELVTAAMTSPELRSIVSIQTQCARIVANLAANTPSESNLFHVPIRQSDLDVSCFDRFHHWADISEPAMRSEFYRAMANMKSSLTVSIIIILIIHIIIILHHQDHVILKEHCLLNDDMQCCIACLSFVDFFYKVIYMC
jgi:hypothetical protein